jgi:hypothetical protein
MQTGVHHLGIAFFSLLFFVDCVLHTVDLGVAQRYCGHALRCALRNNVFGMRHSTLQERLEFGALHVRKDLKKHYKRCAAANSMAAGRRRAAANPMAAGKVSRVQAFCLKKLGDLDKPCLKAKGAQSRAMVWYCRDLMQKHSAVCGDEGELLAVAGSSLVAFYDMLRKEQRRLRLADRKKLMGHCINHLQAYRQAGGHMVPKHHGFMHMTRNVAHTGNPRYTGTYEDEHENGIIAEIGQRVHRSTFVRSTFERLDVFDRLVRPRR